MLLFVLALALFIIITGCESAPPEGIEPELSRPIADVDSFPVTIIVDDTETYPYQLELWYEIEPWGAVMNGQVDIFEQGMLAVHKGFVASLE